MSTQRINRIIPENKSLNVIWQIRGTAIFWFLALSFHLIILHSTEMPFKMQSLKHWWNKEEKKNHFRWCKFTLPIQSYIFPSLPLPETILIYDWTFCEEDCYVLRRNGCYLNPILYLRHWRFLGVTLWFDEWGLLSKKNETHWFLMDR